MTFIISFASVLLKFEQIENRPMLLIKIFILYPTDIECILPNIHYHYKIF